MNHTSQENTEYVFPDYDPDVMNTSDANAIISHFEEVFPIHHHWMQKNDLLLSCLYPHVNYYMEQITVYIKEGYKLLSARERSFKDTTELIKSEFESMNLNESNQNIAMPSDFFDLDKNPFIDTTNI